MIVAAADRDINRIRHRGISLPLTIQSDRIVLYGAEGIAVVGTCISMMMSMSILHVDS